MRARALFLVLWLAAMPAAASHPDEIYVDWVDGVFWGGAAVGVPGVNAQDFPFTVDWCRSRVKVDLQYEPEFVPIRVEGVGQVDALFTFRLELRQGDALLASKDVATAGYGFTLHDAAAGDYSMRLVFTQGANVTWHVRIRGWDGVGACAPRAVVNEVEANPVGLDAGKEWVELFNPDPEDADLTGWTLHATHGTPASISLDGVIVPSHGRFVLTFVDGQFLDNEDEVVELRVLGELKDSTPLLDDTAGDDRTWQRSPEGSSSWAFLAGTPGSPNAV